MNLNEASRLRRSKVQKSLYVPCIYCISILANVMLCTISFASLVTFGTAHTSRDNLRDIKDPSSLCARFFFDTSTHLLLYHWIRGTLFSNFPISTRYCTVCVCMYVWAWGRKIGSLDYDSWVYRLTRALKKMEIDRILPSFKRAGMTDSSPRACLHKIDGLLKICGDIVQGKC